MYELYVDVMFLHPLFSGRVRKRTIGLGLTLGLTHLYLSCPSLSNPLRATYRVSAIGTFRPRDLEWEKKWREREGEKTTQREWYWFRWKSFFFYKRGKEKKNLFLFLFWVKEKRKEEKKEKKRYYWRERKTIRQKILHMFFSFLYTKSPIQPKNILKTKIKYIENPSQLVSLSLPFKTFWI